MATWSNLNLQNSNSPLMEQMIFFHDHSMLMLILITTLVGYIMFSLIINKLINSYFSYNTIIEMIWTILPIFVLIFIAFPSLRLLYLLDNINNPLITIKSMGYQWYWSYSYPNFNNIEYNSYMMNELNNNFRLLEVDNNIIIPFNIQTRILVTAMDVLHAWTIPSLGIKIDAIPGRLNQTNFSINSSNIFYGQCSEICGANHSFMPITMESINLKYFIKWINNFN